MKNHIHQIQDILIPIIINCEHFKKKHVKEETFVFGCFHSSKNSNIYSHITFKMQHISTIKRIRIIIKKTFKNRKN